MLGGGATLMAAYRVYFRDHKNLLKASDEFEAEDDARAMEVATALAGRRSPQDFAKLEVWQNGRMVSAGTI